MRVEASNMRRGKAIRLLGGLALGLALAGCQTTSEAPRSISTSEFAAPANAGETKASLTNPDPARWAGVNRNNSDGNFTLFVCRPEACTTPAAVVYARLRNPLPNPDRKIMLETARENAEKSKAQGWVLISPIQPLTLKGYPAIRESMKRESGGKTEYSHAVTMLAGAFLISLTSRSGDNGAAIRHLDQFIAGLSIKDGGRSPASR